MSEKVQLAEKIHKLLGWKPKLARMKIITDTTDWMRIIRGDVIRLPDCQRDYVVMGNMREPRFGIDDQPKYWVFHAIDLSTGKEKIIKTVFYEEFHVHISIFKIRCYREPLKESEVLSLTKGDKRFMQGYSFTDEAGNNVRIIDYIKGEAFFRYVPLINKSHKRYFEEDLPIILWNLLDSVEAIRFLHKKGFCHGDIRNDHIFIDSKSKRFRWIDFDLNQDVSDFDLWSLGNIICYAVAKGIITFKRVMKSDDFDDKTKANLTPEDGSAFYNYRVMDLQKLFPYIPDKLASILRHFTIKPAEFYTGIDELYDDYREMLENEFPQGKGKKSKV